MLNTYHNQSYHFQQTNLKLHTPLVIIDNSWNLIAINILASTSSRNTFRTIQLVTPTFKSSKSANNHLTLRNVSAGIKMSASLQSRILHPISRQGWNIWRIF